MTNENIKELTPEELDRLCQFFTLLIDLDRRLKRKKRRVIDVLTSNCSYKDGNLYVELKPVYGMILNSSKDGKWCPVLNAFRHKTDRPEFMLSCIQTIYRTFKLEMYK